MYWKIETNLMLNSVIRGFAERWRRSSSRTATIYYQTPVTYLKLECAHYHKALLQSDDFKLAHKRDSL